ncbi:DUF5813 family protein [Halorientalis pallida]|uniref:Uncharacterized protein n=1 Tax=Halorientalis pallida TaxID=2479928 RepID=A0A498L1L3_9EURY|nr:DUF5813 family protein [Halorientalis pallida]RXK51977.1 hypothetical protein EAF64_04925 [Halorientalis pallida]
MTDEIPERAERAFEGHDAFERDGGGYRVTTTRFDGDVTAEETEDWALAYRLVVRTPMLSAAVDGDVGDAVEAGWFDTFERRLEDAPSVTRADVDLDAVVLTEDEDEAVVAFEFEFGNADHAPDVVKAFAEYVEGTYVEGVVPGYDYEGVVADLLGKAASQGGDGERGGTPL